MKLGYTFVPCNEIREPSYFKRFNEDEYFEIIDNLFISLTSSEDVLNLLINKGSVITVI